MPETPPVLMVFTGGTISMKVVPGRGAVPAQSGREILDQVPGMESLARVTCEDFERLPGPHWTPERMMALARYLDASLDAGPFVGAVVTHGTDTLEETAYLLELVLATDKPVVMTGAMKTADDSGWDGPGNLLAAVRAVLEPRDPPGGVTVVMGGAQHAANTVVKSHTSALDAFTSARKRGHRRERISTDRIEPRVDLVTAAIGTDARFLTHAVATGARGVVVAALGSGNVPPAMLEGVRAAVEAGVPVVVASRCGSGPTEPRYGYEGGGVTLKNVGAIFAGDLSAPKARIKLMVLLGSGATPAAIRDSFERPGP
jgi:L-asparaginase